MEPSCLGVLRSLLCCQDEFDDTVHVDFRAIENAFKRSSRSDSESDHRTALLRHSPIPSSVPRHNEATRDLDSESSAALLQRARALWLSSRSSPEPSSSWSSSKSSFVIPKPPIVNSPLPIAPKPAIASSSSLIAPKPAVMSSSSAVVPKRAILSSSSVIVPKPAILSSQRPIALKSAVVSSSSLIVPKRVIVSSQSQIAPKPAIVSSSMLTIASKPSIVSSSSLVAPKPAIASSSSSRLAKAELEASSQEKAPVKKANHAKVDKNGVPLYLVPDHIKDLIKRDVVPRVLMSPVSPTTYKEYFSVLLYAEDYFFEKWTDYELKDVTLELHKANRYVKSKRQKGVSKKDDQIFVEFKIDSFPNKKERPYLLSRDFVYARPSGREIEPFKGLINCVVKSTTILIEFEDDFLSQHYPRCRYDVSFSFNRVCLKRAHEALNSISDTLYENFLFPDSVSRDNIETSSAAFHKIVNIKSPPPYVIVGPRCTSEIKSAAYGSLSGTGLLVQEAVVEIYRADPGRCRVLICSPSNKSCDVLMKGLKRRVPESEMFRANAAFRDKEDVPEDILSSSLYQDRKEYFACPQLEALRSYKIIFCTFMSTYRLHREGLAVGHFTHVFMVDSSFVIEPEALVPLANFADENTVVFVTGNPRDSPNWVRSSIAREKGLRVSYFERLRNCRPYQSLNPDFVTLLDLNRDEGYKLIL